MIDDIVARLRAADEWMLIGLEGLAFSSNAPFEAADEITRLHADLAAMRDALTHANQMQRDTESARVRETNALRADLAAARGLLKEARVRMWIDRWLPAADLCARIDAFLKRRRDEC